MSHAPFVRAAAAALGVAGLFTALTQQPQPQPLTVTRIADDLHVIVGNGGNVAVYTTDEGAILVDDKFERDVPEILAKVKTVTDKPVRYVLNTHLHGDHTGGNAKLLEAGAEIIAHENAVRIMTERKMPGIPRLSYSREFTLTLGGKTVKAHHFGRGHTRTDAFMLFGAHKVIHTGDMYVASSPFIDYSSGGSGIEWTRTLDRAMELDFDTVIPGHGPISKRADLLKWKQSFENLKQHINTLRKEGKAKDEALKGLDLAAVTGWAVSPLAARSLPALWDELAK